MKIPSYTIRHADSVPSLDVSQGVPASGWDCAEIGQISHWHEISGPIRPLTFFRALYDENNLYLRFDVMDQCVRSIHTHLHDNVCVDSCVEFFVQPAPGPTYFNFEINAGGTMLLYRITDPTFIPKPDGGNTFADFSPVSEDAANLIEIHHSLPTVIDPPLLQPLSWSVAYRIPLDFFKSFLGSCAIQKGARWRGNFFKCGGSQPDHFGMWSDVGEVLNFHQPNHFGDIFFD